MRRIPRRRLKRLANDFGDLVIADLAQRAGTGLVIEARHPMFGEPPPPFSDRVGRRAHPQADGLVLPPSAARRTMRARWASPCAVLRRHARLSSAPRSLGVKSIATAVFPIAKILRANARRESPIFVDQNTRTFAT